MALMIKRELPNGIEGTFYTRIERIEGTKTTIHYTAVYYTTRENANPSEIEANTIRKKPDGSKYMVPSTPIPCFVDDQWFTPDITPTAKHHLEQAYAHLKVVHAGAQDA